MIFKNKKGFTLFHLVMIMVGLGLMAAVAVRFMYFSTEESRRKETIDKMLKIVYAIHGNPEIVPQTNFGYVGDLRALPTSLTDLVQSADPEWNGPYFDIGFQEDTTAVLNDAWGQSFIYEPSNGRIISNGMGESIVQKFLLDPVKLLTNSIEGKVIDRNQRIPQGMERFRFNITLTHKGNLGIKTSPSWTTSLDSQGKFYYYNLASGNYLITVEYTRYSLTINKYITIPAMGTLQRMKIKFNVTFYGN